MMTLSLQGRGSTRPCGAERGEGPCGTAPETLTPLALASASRPLPYRERVEG
jgi:hypothetical protein